LVPKEGPAKSRETGFSVTGNRRKPHSENPTSQALAKRKGILVK
jgi:hypothetical protein